jgi:hypothetical protein
MTNRVRYRIAVTIKEKQTENESFLSVFFQTKVPNQKRKKTSALIRKMRKNYINLYIMCKNVEK